VSPNSQVENSCYALTESDCQILEHVTNRMFDLAATNTTVPAKVTVCSATAFADTSVAGLHVLVNVPAQHVCDALRHYRHDKRQAPAGTSACFLVPPDVARRPEVAGLLKGMHHLLPLEPKTDASHPDAEPSVRSWPVMAFYDAVGLQLNAINGCGLSMTMQSIAVQGTVSHVPANISFDSGASECYVSQAFVERAGLAVKPSSERVTLADGSEATALGVSLVHLRLQAFHARMKCFVMKLAPPFDVIIGEPWLREHRAVLDYGAQAVTLRKGTKKIAVSCGPKAVMPSAPYPTNSSDEPPLLRVAQVRRMLRKRERMFVCQVTAADNPEPVADTTSDCLPDIEALITEYGDVLLQGDDLPPGLPPERPDAPQAIPLVPGATPVTRRMYRLSQLERREVERQIKLGLASGRIEPSSSPYSAPVLFVAKKSGELRMCLDWRGLNKQTVRNATVTPDVQTLLDQIGGNRVFSVLDCMAAYNQIRLSDEDKPKTAFRTHIGHYQYAVLGFDLVNAPAVWVTEINRALGDAVGRCCLVYMDDIIIMSKDAAGHAAAVREVLDRLRKANIYVKANKQWTLKRPNIRCSRCNGTSICGTWRLRRGPACWVRFCLTEVRLTAQKQGDV